MPALPASGPSTVHAVNLANAVAAAVPVSTQAFISQVFAHSWVQASAREEGTPALLGLTDTYQKTAMTDGTDYVEKLEAVLSNGGYFQASGKLGIAQPRPTELAY